VNVRPKFLRRLSLFFLCGLLVIAYVYFQPHINLPRPPGWGCPLLAQLKPLDKSPVQPTDFLELVALGSKPPISSTVRIHGDGRVERDTLVTLSGFTFGCPLHEADKHVHIPAAQAIAILSKARDGGFCRLCELNHPTHSAFDGGLEHLTLSFHGNTNTVRNDSGQPPPIFQQLADSFTIVPPFPEYATTHYPTRERMLDCLAFNQSQIDARQPLSKHK
jgi:hypothetical protein